MLTISVAGNRIVVYHESEEELEKLLRRLRELGIEAKIVHTSPCG